MNTRYPDYTLDTDRASRENGSTAYIALDNSTYVIEQTTTKTLSSFPESFVSDTPVSYAHQPSSYAYGVKAITPVIRYAWDDVGQEQGVRASGNRTDDAAPTLRGTGPANTYMDIMFTNGSVTRYNGITTDADGNWSWTRRCAAKRNHHSESARHRFGAIYRACQSFSPAFHQEFSFFADGS